MKRFVAELKDKQADQTDRDFAARLGISQPHWTRVKLGRRPVTLGLATAAVALWPELRQVYLEDIDAKLAASGTPTDSADTEERAE